MCRFPAVAAAAVVIAAKPLIASDAKTTPPLSADR